MGNCCKPASSSMEWDGEDWSDLTTTSSRKVFAEAHGRRRGLNLSLGKVQKEKLMAMGELRASPDAANGKVVKIRISKKDLAELLEKQQQQQHVNNKKQSAEQVLLRLIKARDHDTCHRLWMPVLETIPELI